MLTPEQLAFRRSGLGSSDIPAVLGLSKWRKPVDVYADKRGLSEPFAETAPMKAGSRLEPVTGGYFVDATGCTLLTAPEYALSQGSRFGKGAEIGIYQHPEHPYFMASPDRIAVFSNCDAILELKFATARSAGYWGETGSQDYPLDYSLQVQWQMFVAGMDKAYLAVLIGGEDFRYYEVPRDDELIAMMKDKAYSFWHDHVLTGIPPATVDDSPAWRKLAEKAVPKSFTKATPEHEALYREYSAAKQASEAAETTLETVKNKIILAMGSTEKLIGDTWTATYSERKGRTTIDWEALCQELGVPDATIRKFQTVGKPTRVLSVK